MTIVAVALKTESGDDYLFIDHIDVVVEKIAESMGEELLYVWSRSIETWPSDPEMSSLVREKLYNPASEIADV